MITSIDNISQRITKLKVHRNPQTTDHVITYYIPTNASEEFEVETFYTQLPCIIREIPKHKVMIIGA